MQLNAIKLKIKVKYLTAEARINRKEANKLHGLDKHDLNHHRKTKLREEARATHLAYGYLRGIPYASMEQKVKNQHLFNWSILPRVKKMAEVYGDSSLPTVDEWIGGAVREKPEPTTTPITTVQYQTCYA